MITLSNGNVYTMQGFYVNIDTGSVQATYQVTNPATDALGFPPAMVVFEMGGMPGIQAAFESPMTTALPLFPVYEQWLISDHSTDGQTALQIFTGGTIS
jgi:hypothetical protein